MSIRDRVWQLVEDPGSSTAAQAYAVFISCVCLLSAVATMWVTFVKANTDVTAIGESTSYIFIADMAARLATCPAIRKFYNDPYHIIDTFVLLPFVGQLISPYYSPLAAGQRSPEFVALYASQPLFRILKLARNFDNFRVLVRGLSRSLASLQVPVFILLFLTVAFGTLFYYFEKDLNTAVSGIPDTVWWGVVTVSTVGYGDFYPVTTSGWWITSILIIVGIFFLTMPLSIVGTNYIEAWLSRNKFKVIERMNYKMQSLKMKENDAELLFRLYKTGSDRGMTLEEFKAMLVDLRVTLDISATLELFHELDPHMSGIVTFPSFASVLFADFIWVDTHLKRVQDSFEIRSDTQSNALEKDRLLSMEEATDLAMSIVKTRLAQLDTKVKSIKRLN